MPRFIAIINNIIHRQLSFGYDVGKGFIVGEEEVTKNLHDMVADDRVERDLKSRLEKSRLDVVKSLGECVFLKSRNERILLCFNKLVHTRQEKFFEELDCLVFVE